MDLELDQLLIFLALFSIGAVLVFAIISKRKTEKRRLDETVAKSRLAEDAPNK